MSGIPLPSTTTKTPSGKGWGLYQVARSRRGLSLLLILTLSSLFYILDAGPFLDRLRSHQDAVAPAWPEAGDESAVDSGTEALTEPLPPTPLTSLGLEADMSFHLGSTSKAAYKAELEQFVARAFPSWLRDRAQASIELFLGDSNKMVSLPGMPHNIYQTAKKEPHWGWDTSSWRKVPNYTHFFFDDAAADAWVRKVFNGTEIEIVWDIFGPGIKRSDLLRYLLVMTEGGIYTDMDTRRLKDISMWGNGADTQGLSHMGLPSIFVGVEADVGTRSDWRKWWPRPLQIVQWTFGAAPLHPILIDTVRRVHHVTAVAEANKAKSDKGAGASIVAEEHWVGGELLRDDGSISIMEWTGPGVFTDSVLRYLAAEHNTSWPALKNLRRPVRIRDTVVLPVTGFSPGVGLFGAGELTDREAMVHHLFAGSWKTGKHNE